MLQNNVDVTLAHSVSVSGIILKMSIIRLRISGTFRRRTLVRPSWSDTITIDYTIFCASFSAGNNNLYSPIHVCSCRMIETEKSSGYFLGERWCKKVGTYSLFLISDILFPDLHIGGCNIVDAMDCWLHWYYLGGGLIIKADTVRIGRRWLFHLQITR